jgi:hypothetical protein
MNNKGTAVRQIAEWGMQGVQSSFARLKEKIKFEEQGEHKVILYLMVYLYNLELLK